MCSKAKLIDPPTQNESRVFARSERIPFDHQRLKALSANDLRDFICDVLENTEFNADKVDHDTHERLARVDGDTDIFDIWMESNGKKDVRFFKRRP